MVRKQRARLISPDDVERVFDDSAIQCLAQAARLPRSADLTRFGRSIRAAVHQYLIDANAPQPGEHRAAIASLARKARDALDGKPGALEATADALEALHPATREMFVEDIAYPMNFPTVRDLRDPVHGRKALSRLWGLCHRGAEWKEGRRRPGGKRSRPRLEPLLVDPRLRWSERTQGYTVLGRPPRETELVMLCMHLGDAYWRATGKMPPRRADPRTPGPFLRLVREVLRMVGAAHIDAAELVEASYGRRQRYSRRRRPPVT